MRRAEEAAEGLDGRRAAYRPSGICPLRRGEKEKSRKFRTSGEGDKKKRGDFLLR